MKKVFMSVAVVAMMSLKWVPEIDELFEEMPKKEAEE